MRHTLSTMPTRSFQNRIGKETAYIAAVALADHARFTVLIPRSFIQYGQVTVFMSDFERIYQWLNLQITRIIWLTPGTAYCRTFLSLWAAVSSRGSTGIETPLGAFPGRSGKAAKSGRPGDFRTAKWRSRGDRGLSHGEVAKSGARTFAWRSGEVWGGKLSQSKAAKLGAKAPTRVYRKEKPQRPQKATKRRTCYERATASSPFRRR